MYRFEGGEDSNTLQELFVYSVGISVLKQLLNGLGLKVVQIVLVQEAGSSGFVLQKYEIPLCFLCAPLNANRPMEVASIAPAANIIFVLFIK
jgi:hypothetical protein